MAGPKRRAIAPEPEPPRLEALVVDGANVIASSRHRPLERLALAEAWCASFRPDLPVLVFVDFATVQCCKPPVQATLRARCQDVTPGRPRYAIPPRGESADGYLLAHAQSHQGLVLSNDRFWDFEELRRGVVTLQFHLKGDVLRVYDEATWFCGDAAVRLSVSALQLAGEAGERGGGGED
ncbi:MAG: hypothetical protein AB8H80_18950 [Planctomycetota bacterium]